MPPIPKGKSHTHLRIQQALQSQLFPEETFLEERFDSIGRIADLYWPAQKIVFEVQVSSIGRKEIEERNTDYAKLGLSVIWILHDRNFNHFHLSKAEIFLRHTPHYFTNINAQGKGSFYDQQCRYHCGRRIERTQRQIVNFKRLLPLNLKQFPSHFPKERIHWKYYFETEGGSFLPPIIKAKKLRRLNPFLLYRMLLRLLLEKTTL